MNANIVDLAVYLSKQTPESILKKAVNSASVEAEIVDINTRRQLGAFKDSEGKFLADIGGEYSHITQEIKGLGPREVNLNDEGDFWESFEVSYEKQGYTIDSDTIKNGVDLREEWGDNIEGIDKKYNKEVNAIITKKIIFQTEESL